MLSEYQRSSKGHRQWTKFFCDTPRAGWPPLHSKLLPAQNQQRRNCCRGGAGNLATTNASKGVSVNLFGLQAVKQWALLLSFTATAERSLVFTMPSTNLFQWIIPGLDHRGRAVFGRISNRRDAVEDIFASSQLKTCKKSRSVRLRLP